MKEGMLRVPTIVAPSSIEGVGLFAATNIRKGTVVWEFEQGVDWTIPKADFTRFPEPYRSWLRRYVYQSEAGHYVLCGDNGKYMNHSFQPNCDDSGTVTVALRDIAAGEELTCDYRLFEFDAEVDVELQAFR